MSPIGRILFENCDTTVEINLKEVWYPFYLLGYSKMQVEQYCQAIGIAFNYTKRPFAERVDTFARTVPGLTFRNRRTMLGVPEPRVGGA